MEQTTCCSKKDAQKKGVIRRGVLVFFSIPWCCVVSLAIAFFTTTGSLLGFFFDNLMHDVIPFLVLFHVYGIVTYVKHREKTQGRTLFLAFTTILFFLSVGFHFTELHDHILGHN